MFNHVYSFLFLLQITVGRSKQSHYIIEDLLLSRKHVIFRLIDKSKWTVESLVQ